MMRSEITKSIFSVLAYYPNWMTDYNDEASSTLTESQYLEFVEKS